ncbi:MAG TPA: glycosyltransferase family 39 protein [Chitinophagales bacterium]|nr:glycosyltransferase family 39 protein [Chitinophagales bacterium]
MKFFLRTTLPIIIGVLLLVYIVARAILLPITIDEADTCLKHATASFHDIVTFADPIPNNHILNTLLIKLSASIFGMHTLPARLPNILGFVLYFTMIFLITRRISDNPIIILLGIVVMTFNPYLIDFFSLARGYALSISFMAASLYFAWCFVERKSNRDLAWSVFFAIVSAYSNFTTLNFFVALVALLGIILFQENFSSAKTPEFLKRTWKAFAIIFSGCLLLAVISYLPIKVMEGTNQFVFWGSKGIYESTLIPLVAASQYHINYFSISEKTFSNMLIVFLIIILLPAIWVWKSDRWQIGKHPQVFFMMIFIGTLAVNILQFHLIHTPYLDARAGLFFYPLMAINIVLFASWLHAKTKASLYFFSIPVILLAMLHISRSINFKYCYQWWFNQHTYTVLNYLREEHEKNTVSPVSLDVSWLFYGSLYFHIVTDPEDWIQLKPFHMDVKPDSAFEYYYLFENEKSTLDSQYVSVLSFPDGQNLMRRKDFSGEKK